VLCLLLGKEAGEGDDICVDLLLSDWSSLAAVVGSHSVCVLRFVAQCVTVYKYMYICMYAGIALVNGVKVWKKGIWGKFGV
jgi:hypothetical protein